MKIATYNIQNLFHRHVDLIYKNREIKSEEWNDEFETLLLKLNRKDSDYRRMRELADLMGLHYSDNKPNLNTRNFDIGNSELKTIMHTVKYSEYSFLKVRGNSSVVAIPPQAIKNKAKVIFDANPDILLLQEVESRSSLLYFNDLVFKEREENGFKEIIHLDGNGRYELGMGILLKEGYRVKAIRSFSSERDVDGSFLFTNDLQSYKIETPIGQFVYILCVQLTSDSMDGSNEEKRTRQAELVSKVYQELRSMGNDLIIVLGTLNAPNHSKSISPIMETDMTNVAKLANFDVELDAGNDSRYHRLGAYRTGVNLRQLDYLLVSPFLFTKVIASGMNRKAIWPLTQPQWSTYESMKKETHAASEHPLIWADFNIPFSSPLGKVA